MKRKSSHAPLTKIVVVENNDHHWTTIQTVMKCIMPNVIYTRTTSTNQTLALLDTAITSITTPPQLILSDLYLPEREEGLSLISSVRNYSNPLNLIPIVIFSSSDKQEDIVEAYQQGCSSYVKKPSTSEDWLIPLQAFKAYWTKTASLPKLRIEL